MSDRPICPERALADRPLLPRPIQPKMGPGGDGAALTLPVAIAIGAERWLTEQIKAGARFNLRPAFFDNVRLVFRHF